MQSRHYSIDNTSELRSKQPSLFQQLSARIMACGPITVADYMKEVLTHPTAGYYMNKDVFGEKGDFITSPEITQIFGEMLGVWIINEWSKISRGPFQLVELGPGRGTLSKDILRVFKQLKIIDKVSLHLVEVSPTLSAIQAKNLCTSTEEVNPLTNKNGENSISHYRKGITNDGVKIFWYYSITDVPRDFSIFLAHEFFDALPIHKFQRTSEGWREVLVDIDPVANNQEKFRYVISRMATPSVKAYVSENEPRDHLEVSPQSIVIADHLSSFLYENGGFVLIADYGHDGEKTDTFRAFRQHQLHDPLINPGTADLTADVDFSLFKRIASNDNKLITFGPINQRDFLKQLGIDIRLQMLLRNAPEDQRDQIQSAYHMITDEDQMGKCFKMLSMFPAILKKHFEKWPVSGFQKIDGLKK
ncbi:protein arginine methyltransferase NDUFAF7 homolog, mitochondrial isoform X2 [Cephus cinctus]|nr:protein arginine methyltransferase NDUFAF7 homolog, mitochondrial isoform X2 [Cephus cinctus]